MNGFNATKAFNSATVSLRESLELLFSVIFSAVVGGAVYVFIGSLSKVIVLLGRARVAIVKFQAAMAASAAATKSMGLSLSSLNAALLTFGGGIGRIVFAIGAFISSFTLLNFYLDDFTGKTDEAIAKQEELNRVINEARNSFVGDFTPNLINPEATEVIDNYIKTVQDLEGVEKQQKDILTASLEATKELNSARTEAGLRSGNLVRVQTELGDAILSVKDAVEIAALTDLFPDVFFRCRNKRDARLGESTIRN